MTDSGSEGPPQTQSVAKQYYLKTVDDQVVPLIRADHLPAELARLYGPQLSSAQEQGHTVYIIDAANIIEVPANEIVKEVQPKVRPHDPADSDGPLSIRSDEAGTRGARPIGRDANKVTHDNKRTRTSLESVPKRGEGRKEWCSHWIRTGECEFMQRGCIFKHEMPSGEVLRSIIGTDRTPKWWLDRDTQGQRGRNARRSGRRGHPDRSSTSDGPARPRSNAAKQPEQSLIDFSPPASPERQSTRESQDPSSTEGSRILWSGAVHNSSSLSNSDGLAPLSSDNTPIRRTQARRPPRGTTGRSYLVRRGNARTTSLHSASRPARGNQ